MEARPVDEDERGVGRGGGPGRGAAVLVVEYGAVVVDGRGGHAVSR